MFFGENLFEKFHCFSVTFYSFLQYGYQGKGKTKTWWFIAYNSAIGNQGGPLLEKSLLLLNGWEMLWKFSMSRQTASGLDSNGVAGGKSGKKLAAWRSVIVDILVHKYA